MGKQERTQYPDRDEIQEMIEQYLAQRGIALSDYDAMAAEQKRIESIVEQTIF